jgi:AGCS family alanine or glycine:cation symporter
VRASFGVPTWVSGLVLMAATAAVVLGGIKSIGRVTAVLVPVMILCFSLGALVILALAIDKLPAAIALVFEKAFTPTAASGGFLGSTVMLTMRIGVARGLFSNESGLGSAPIAAAAAQTRHPVAQALVSMTQTFIDTLVVCSMTGLVLIVSGAWNNGQTGAELTGTAFAMGLPGVWGHLVVTLGLILFAYSTMLGWCYYGEKSVEYLVGPAAVRPYRLVFVLFIGVGALLRLDLVWGLADVFNGLMAVPNLIALLLLTPVVVSETRDYLASRRA